MPRSDLIAGTSRRPPSRRTAGATSLATRIKLAREQLGLSQRALGARLGISAGAVGQWETGKAKPSISRLETLSETLAVSLDWLLGNAGQAPAPPPEALAVTAADMEVLDQARELGIDLKQVVADARRRRWLEENRAAIADANAFLERYGLWSDGRRLF